MDWTTLILLFMGSIILPQPAYGASASELDYSSGPYRVDCAKEATITVTGLTAVSGAAPLEVSTRETTTLKATAADGMVVLSDPQHLSICPTASGPSLETLGTPTSAALD